MTIFGLKVIVKSGLEKNILKFHIPHKEIRSIFFPLPYEDGSRAVIGVK